MDSLRTRPRVKLTPTPTQVGLSVFTAICMAAVWLIFALYYPRLPATIATHFGATGAPDATGPKSSLVPLPVITTLTYLLFTVLIRVPHIYNYPKPITEENAERQYGNAVALMYWLRAEMVAMLGYIEWMIIGAVFHRTQSAQGMGLIFVPVVLILMIFAGGVVYMVRAYRDT